MAEVSDITIKRTQDLLGKIIKKPVLTDKLLRKPPFKFLHDIIHAVIKNTGFLNGLYTDEELQSETIKDRDAKIAFLQKTIDTLKLATKQDVKARPSKIVAGLEADKTNELLIAIAKAIDRKIDTTDAVALVKSGKVNITKKKDSKVAKVNDTSPRKASKESITSAKTKVTDKTLKKTVSNSKAVKQSSKESNDSTKIKTKSAEKDKEKHKKREKQNNILKKEVPVNADEVTTKISVDPIGEATHVNGHVNDAIIDEESKPNNAKVELSETVEKQEDLPNENLGQREGENLEKQDGKARPEEKDTETKEGKQEKVIKISKTNRDEKNLEKKSEELAIGVVDDNQMPKLNLAQEIKTKSQDNITNNTASAEKPRSSKLKKSSDVINSKPDSIIPKKILESSKSYDLENPPKTRAALRSAAVRPISARPSAPRRRDRNVRQILHTESFIQEPNNENTTSKKNNIPDFDDADNIVITESVPDSITAIDETATNKDGNEIDGKMGHLVQQILETQTSILKDAKNDTLAANNENMLIDRKSITRNMTELRKMIQSLSLYIIPLGKMMEYFQEDVDAMQIELMMWKTAGETAQADIKEEQRSTEKLLENFKYQLAEIENSIKEHTEQINNTTTNIIQNEEKINKIFTTL